jgi:hypothetical protein
MLHPLQVKQYPVFIQIRVLKFTLIISVIIWFLQQSKANCQSKEVACKKHEWSLELFITSFKANKE